MEEGYIIDGRYKVQNKLGQGGMGQVFRGHDIELNKQVAIKVLFPNTPDQIIKRFHAEAKALAALNHPNIMSVLHFGQAENGQLYLIMDFVKGESLSTMIEKRGVQTFFDVLPIFERICRGLRYAHMNHVLHRDIKPSNVMMKLDRSQEDAIKLVDFGLAKQADKDHELTKTGAAMGSPPYMSPEAVHGKNTDERSDIYSLGCTFFEMMAARPPFQGDTQFHTMMAHLNRLPPTLEEVTGKTFEPEVEEFIQKCLKKNPDDRFQNMDEMIAALEKVKNTLIERKRASEGILASGVYASGAWIADKTRKLNMLLSKSVIASLVVFVIVFAVIAYFTSQLKATNTGNEVRDEAVAAMMDESRKSDIEKTLDLNMESGITKQRAGASIQKDRGSNRQCCRLSGSMTDEELDEAVRPYKHMEVFQLEDLEISEQAMRSLLSLPMTKLVLRNMKLNAGLGDEIGKMTRLEQLEIGRCNELPDGCLNGVNNLKTLTLLDLHLEKSYGNPGAIWANMNKLGILKIREARLNRSDIELLSKLPALIILNMRMCDFSDDALVDLQNARLCRVLSIGETMLTAQQVEQISQLPQLIDLDITTTNVDDTSVQYFARTKSLKLIDARNTQVTAHGVSLLKAAIPTLEKVQFGRKIRDVF